MATDSEIRDKQEMLAKLKMEKERLEAEIAKSAEQLDEGKPAPSRTPSARKKQVARGAGHKSASAATQTAAVATVEKVAKRPSAPAPSRTPSAQPVQQQASPAETVAETDAANPEETQEERGPAGGFGLPRFLRSAPAWLVSLIFHLVALVILGLMTLPVILKQQVGDGIVATTVIEEETLEEFEFETEMEELEEVEFQDVTMDSVAAPDPGMIAMGDVSAEVATATATEVGLMAASPIGDVADLFGSSGKGLVDVGDGLTAAASFFGTKASGRKFVFVVDNSNSMGKGRFVTALDEMIKSVDAMTPKQSFYVIFFSDTAYMMFHPNPAPRLVPATEDNKEKLRAWLYTVERCLKTKGELAMERALSLRPDAIYILGDGAFTDKTGAKLTAPHNRRVAIHTFGMEVSARGRQELTAIANANNGTFREVRSTPQAAEAERKLNIPKNNKRGPVWGIELPVNGKK